MADVAIVVTTYFPPGDVGARRAVAAARAMQSWLDNLHGASLKLVVVDDGSAPEYYAGRGRWMNIDMVLTPRLGCGGALAAGVKHVVDNGLAPVIFYAQDDWELLTPLDLAPSLALITDYADIVRLGPTHPNLDAHVFRTMNPAAEWCLEYEWEGGGYVASWRPALYHTSIFEGVAALDGLEGLACIEAERIWLERMAHAAIQPRVFHAPNCTLAGPFEHIETEELGEDAPETLTARYGNG